MINAFDTNSISEILNVGRHDRTIELLQGQKSSTANLLKLKEDESGLKAASEEFEAIFINMLLQQFRNSIPEDGLIPKSNSLKMYEELLDQQTSTNLSQNGNLGMADMIFTQLKGMRDAYGSVSSDAETGKNLEREG